MMAYNGFPTTYQPMYYQPQYQTQQQQNGIIWVQGEAGAKSYLVAPNSTVQLWDSERQTIYLKSADASGMPSMKILDYTIRENTPVNTPISANTDPDNKAIEYATKSEIQAITAQIEALQAQLDGMATKKKEAAK